MTTDDETFKTQCINICICFADRREYNILRTSVCSGTHKRFVRYMLNNQRNFSPRYFYLLINLLILTMSDKAFFVIIVHLADGKRIC
jgi:hypothetical protein